MRNAMQIDLTDMNARARRAADRLSWDEAAQRTLDGYGLRPAERRDRM